MRRLVLDPGLSARAVEGDSEALEEVLRLARPALVHFCNVRLGTMRGEDVAQEILVSLLRAVPKYRDRGHQLESLIFRVAENRVMDAHRKWYRRHEDAAEMDAQLVDPHPGPEQLLSDHLQSEALVALLARLSPMRAQALALWARGMDATEAGEAMGCSPGAMRVLQHRALKQLREMATEG